MKAFISDFKLFIQFILHYCRKKLFKLAFYFEKLKNFAVSLLLFKRGIFQKKVWHTSMIALSAFALITSGVFGGQTIVSSSFPGVGGGDPRFAQAYEPSSSSPVLNSLYDTHTNISQKPRSEIIEYEVKSGDTLSFIAEKFAISIETIKWANDLDDIHTIKPGQKLKILPVSGVSYTVKSGDNLEAIAKKYSAQSQAILDFPFNDIPDDLSLKIGQVLIIPDGSLPQAKAKSYIAQGPSSATFSAPGGANFIWPVRGILTQYFSWYHPGLDIANSSAPPVAASDGGVVVVAGWPDSFGYGNRVVIDHGNNYRTLYAHLSNIYVYSGQTVSRGQLIGRMGSTGRSTGTHTHFEIRFKGIAVNPLSILK